MRICTMISILPLLAGFIPVSSSQARADGEGGEFRLTKSQLTRGPDHHLFGYIGQSLTVPWNANNRYVVALRTDFHDRLPGAGDAADVVLIDTHNENKVEVLDRTFGWNLQQGSMLYWNPEQPETQFFFNDRDPQDGRVFTVLYDIAARRRVQEYRYALHSMGNSGVSPVGGEFAAINYGRMARLRPVTGYAGALDETEGIDASADDGIFLINIRRGDERLLLSFARMAEMLKTVTDWEILNKRWTPVDEAQDPSAKPDTSEAKLYINHTLFNRTGDRLYFFLRGRREKQSIWLNVPCSIKTDGTEFVVHQTSVGGHPEWGRGDTIIGARDGHQVVYDVVKQRLLPESTLGTPEIFPVPEGDVSLSPDGEWFVNGYSSEDRQTITYVVMRLADGAFARSQPFDRGPYTKGNLRTDPAPRWNRSSNAILVPGWTDEGTRQLFVLKINPLQ